MPETDIAAPSVPFVDHPLIDLSADPFTLLSLIHI